MASLLQQIRQTVRSGPPPPPQNSTDLAYLLPLTAAEGRGLFPAHSGQLIGHGDRYKVVRLLGIGSYSSVFLVEDLEREGEPLAVKILTARATISNSPGNLHELGSLQALLRREDTGEKSDGDYLSRLKDYFKISGPHGDHLCLVLDPQSITVDQYRRSLPSRTLQPHLVQLIAYQTIVALASVHRANLIHTDLHSGNILIADIGVSDGEISPIEGTVTIAGSEYTALLRPQPLPAKWENEADVGTIKHYRTTLSDLGSTRSFAEARAGDDRVGTPFALRAPELVLRCGYDAKIDIWALGCLVFELLTGSWLFRLPPGQVITADELHLASMLSLTGESFTPAMIARSERRNELFDSYGNMRVKMSPQPIESALENYEVLHPDDMGIVSDFIRKCLHLDPAERPSAEELLDHEWIRGMPQSLRYRTP